MKFIIVAAKYKFREMRQPNKNMKLSVGPPLFPTVSVGFRELPLLSFSIPTPAYVGRYILKKKPIHLSRFF